MVIDVGDSGRCSDDVVFANSEFGQIVLTQSLDFSPPEDLRTGDVVPFCIVADAAFSMKPNIMRPYSGRSLPENEKIFNYRLSRARRVIENTFRVLSSRWRIFRRPI